MIYVLLAGLTAALTSMAGIGLARRYATGTRHWMPDVLAIAAGLITGSTFLHFLPELALEAPRLFPLMALAFYLLYIFQHHFAPHFHATPAEEEHLHHHVLGLLVGLAFFVHAAFDGLTLGTGLAYGRGLEWSAVLAVVGHKLPEGVVTYTVFLHSGYAPPRALAYAMIIAWATPVLALFTYFLAASLPPAFLHVALALATGSLLYIGATDLLPEVAHFRGWRKTGFIFLGVLLVALLRLLH